MASLIQGGGALGDDTNAVTRAFTTNVTAGSLIVVKGTKVTITDDQFVAGDCTKSAGTATIGPVSLDVVAHVNYEGPGYLDVGIWSAIVTGGGSLTMRVAGNSGDYLMLVSEEWSGSWDGDRVEDTASATTASNNTSASSGNATSAGAAMFAGALAVSNNGGMHTITPDGAFTQVFEEQDEDLHTVGSAIYRVVGSGTTDSADWSLSNNLGWAAVLAVYKEVSSGGGFQAAWARGSNVLIGV